MRTVAREVGVATSTVSRALRDDPTIPPDRCKEIQKAAERLGYRPNPMVSSLMAQLHGHRRRIDPHLLSWIDLWTHDIEAQRGHDSSSALRGARQRAAELGYGIEVHHPTRDGISPARLRKILVTRSQWGVIFPPVPESAFSYGLDMTGLTGVAIGTSLQRPEIHRVSHNHYQGGLLACTELRTRGFRRIGFVESTWSDERVDGRWRAAYVLQQSLWPRTERLPPLLTGPRDKPAFERWRQRHQPDAIIVMEPHVEVWLRELKVRAIQVVNLALDVTKHDSWGIDYRWEILGAAAVELVVGQIHRNERGCPPIAHTLLIDGIWVGGKGA